MIENVSAYEVDSEKVMYSVYIIYSVSFVYYLLRICTPFQQLIASVPMA